MQDRQRAFYIPLERRKFLKSLALASAGFTLPGYLAEALTLTPNCTQGPYYPRAVNIPLDDDNDLVELNDNMTIASGIVTYLSGYVLDSSGNPIKDALVEIWHADNAGNYIYSASSNRNPAADPYFAGFGQFITGRSGAYLFRTVKAGLYVGRTRHFHFGVTTPGQLTRFTTQLFWNEIAYGTNGQPWATQNSNDMVWTGITNVDQRNSVTLNYMPVPGSTTGEVMGTYDFVIGQTPIEPNYPGSGWLLTEAAVVAGPSGTTRFRITFPAYNGYTYEVYGNPTLADLSWRALPFSFTQMGTIDRNRYTATANGSLTIFVEERAVKDFYKVTFRVPGANVGTP
jgi:protocatechuate 3,4-dioxygenase beta subunit